MPDGDGPPLGSSVCRPVEVGLSFGPDLLANVHAYGPSVLVPLIEVDTTILPGHAQKSLQQY